MSIARKYLLLSALLGAAVSLALFCLLMVSYNENGRLESRVEALERQVNQESEARNQVAQMAGPGVATSPSDQLFKDLSTRFVGDARTIAEKLNDFLKDNTGQQNIAIAAKVIAELADNRDAMSDEDLRWLSTQDVPTTIKRVAAQVLSFRGDNQLIDAYIAQIKPALNSVDAAERRKALGELAKTRYAGAADIILPSLQDSDTTVLLDALLALRATGNEKHAEALKSFQDHADESVAWLANDALNNLETLSEKARQRLLVAEIVAELPIIAP